MKSNFLKINEGIKHPIESKTMAQYM